MDEWKPCNQCGTTRLRSEFYRAARNKDGLQSICKWCSIANVDKWRRDNPERTKENARNYMRRRRAAA